MRLPHLPRTFWILLALGALLRVAAIEWRPEGAMLVAPDEPEYLEIAQNLAAGNGFAIHGQPTAYRDLLFPFWAAAKGSVVGAGHGVLYAQLVADLLTALMLYLLIRRRLSERAAIFGAGVWLLYPAAILFTALFLTETLFVFLWVLALLIFDRIKGRTAVRGYLLLGLVLGLLLLARSTGVILLAAILLTLLYRRRFRTAMLVLGVTFLTILPWMLRNAKVMGSFALNTNSGINLFIGNNPYATGAYRWDRAMALLLSEPIPPTPARPGPETVRYSSEFWGNRHGAQYALRYMAEHPLRTLALWPKKFAYLWSTDMSLCAHYIPHPEFPLRWQLRVVPRWLLVATGLAYMLLAAGGIAGIILVKTTPLRSVLVIQLLLATLAALATYGLARYHFPLMPALVIGTASLAQNPKAWKEATRAQRAGAVFIAAIFSVIWLAEIWTVATG